MPNISTCDAAFIKSTIAKSDKAVAVAWSESAGVNGIVEKVSELEQAGIPVFVLDLDSCGKVGEEFNVKPGDTLVFNKGREVGRVASSADLNGDMVKVKEIASR